jgi:hypothetical protein
MHFVISNANGYSPCDQAIEDGKEKLGKQHGGEIPAKLFRVLRNMPIIEVVDAEIQQHLKQHGEIKNGKIYPILSRSNSILDTPVDTQNPKRLDKKIQE